MALQKTVKPAEQLELLKIFKILTLYIYSQIIFSPKNFCSKPWFRLSRFILIMFYCKAITICMFIPFTIVCIYLECLNVSCIVSFTQHKWHTYNRWMNITECCELFIWDKSFLKHRTDTGMTICDILIFQSEYFFSIT